MKTDDELIQQIEDEAGISALPDGHERAIRKAFDELREGMLRKLASGLYDMGTQIPDNGNPEKWYENLKLILE